MCQGKTIMTETMRWNTHYDVLEVVEHASKEVIRGAYKHLQQKWHPDKNPSLSGHAADLARRINAAYEVLSDPVLREEYNEQLKQDRAQVGARAYAGPFARRLSTAPTSGQGWIAGSIFLVALTTFATNGRSSPVAPPTAVVRISVPAPIAAYRPSERMERLHRRSDLLNRLMLNAEKISALEISRAHGEQVSDTPSNERARREPSRNELVAWWRDAALLAADQFKLMYAGTIQGEPSIGLLFSSPVSIRSLKKNVTVLTADGEPAKGHWILGRNPRFAKFENLGPGRYTVILKPKLSDEGGQTLGLALRGPVVVEPVHAAYAFHDVQGPDAKRQKS